MNLIEYSKNLVANKPLFEEIAIIDWFDAIVTGLCNLKDINKWYLASLFYIEMDSKLKAYSLLEVSSTWVHEVQNISNDILSLQSYTLFKKIKQ